MLDSALRLLQAQAALPSAPPAWICTSDTQPTSTTTMQCTHAGLWGLARVCRTELSTLTACTVDVKSGTQGLPGLQAVLSSSTLRLPSGSVRGLTLNHSLEPEAAVTEVSLHVPRLVGPYNAIASSLAIQFTAVSEMLDEHISRAMAELDMERLPRAFELLELLCQQYVRDAVLSATQEEVPVWHHKLLYEWCSKQTSPPADADISPADVIAAHPALWAEVQLAERVGPHFGEALTSSVAYQELLFPGGSMEAVLPLYEQATVNAFYNRCVVVAVEAVLALLPEVAAAISLYLTHISLLTISPLTTYTTSPPHYIPPHHIYTPLILYPLHISSQEQGEVVVLEVGAGSGGTASSVLPVLDGKCGRYVFTDVSEVFLRQVRVTDSV